LARVAHTTSHAICYCILCRIGENNICTLNDFADLATFELVDKEEGIFKDLDIDENIVNTMIMKAREKWFVEQD
jgi:hypothetical protein